MITLLIIYFVISAILIASIIIPDKTIDDIGGKIALLVFCILISPIIVAIAIGWMMVKSIGDLTVNRKKIKEARLKSYAEVSNGTQKRLTNCMKRYFEYFGRT